MLPRQAPADLDGRGEWRLETDHAEPGKPDELAGILALQRPEAKTVLGKMTTDSPDQ
ncbi:hypothetical protein D3C86_2260320 [compost metagenome]